MNRKCPADTKSPDKNTLPYCYTYKSFLLGTFTFTYYVVSEYFKQIYYLGGTVCISKHLTLVNMHKTQKVVPSSKSTHSSLLKSSTNTTKLKQIGNRTIQKTSPLILETNDKFLFSPSDRYYAVPCCWHSVIALVCRIAKSEYSPE